jgi:HlyD family secretion protein
MKRTLKKLTPLLLALVIAGALAFAFWPRPVPVDVAEVRRAPLIVTVDEDGRTRIRERYTVSAPLMGRMSRIALKAGDPVEAGRTVLTTIEPVEPSLLDPRAAAEAELRVRTAEAGLRGAEPEVSRAGAALELAQSELARTRQAAQATAGAQMELERAILAERQRTAELRAAEFAVEIARYELDLARAALQRTQSGQQPQDNRLDVSSPITGRILRVVRESSGVVQPGEELVEVGDPSDLEIEVDVLSRDAVRIVPGAGASLEHWGGERPLEARVRLVEPAGFTKISALGVEEQRVFVLLDLVKPAPTTLGHGYRVEARIVTSETADTLQIPVGALLRDQGRWAVFVVENGKANLRAIELGRRNEEAAEVLEGLTPGQHVIISPGDKITSGASVRER